MAHGKSKSLYIIIAVIVVGGGVAFWLSNRDSKPDQSVKNPVIGVVENKQAKSEASAREKNLATLLNSTESLEHKVDALAKLTGEPTPAEKKTLREIISNQKQHPTTRNNVVVLLANCKNKIPELGRDLVNIFKDENEGHVFRDYAIQHMATVYEFADNKPELEQTLFAAAKMPSDKKNNFGGTALLALQDIAKINPRVTKRMEFIARETVLAKKPDAETAVTALNISRTARDKAVLDKARKLAQDASALTRLRMSACGYLGELGEKQDVAILKKLAQSKDSRIKRAASYNLKMLLKKIGA